jgi:hypothetical protein
MTEIAQTMIGLACIILATGAAASFVIAAVRSSKGGDSK